MDISVKVAGSLNKKLKTNNQKRWFMPRNPMIPKGMPTKQITLPSSNGEVGIKQRFTRNIAPRYQTMDQQRHTPMDPMPFVPKKPIKK